MNITPEEYAGILAKQKTMQPTGNLRRQTPMTPIEQSPAKVSKTATAALLVSKSAKQAISGKQSITLPYPPTANTFKSAIVVNGRACMILTKRAREYKAAAAAAVQSAGLSLLDGPLTITLRVFRPRKVGDLDNSLKIAIDCLKGAAFRDDEQIVEIRAFRYDDKHCPRVEMSWAVVGAANGGEAR